MKSNPGLQIGRTGAAILGAAVAVAIAVATVLYAKAPGSDSSQPTGVDSTDSKDAKAKNGRHDTSTGPSPLDTWKAIDAHTHLSGQPYSLYGRLMDRHRIYRAVNLSGGRNPRQRKRNLELIRPVRNRIGLFFNVDWDGVNEPAFGKRVAKQLQKAVENGFAGLKISKTLGLGVKNEQGEYLPVDAPRLDPIWEKAGQLGIPVTIHTADPKAFFEKPGPQNERHEELSLAPEWSFYGDEYPDRKTLLAQRDRLVKRHRDTTFILAHFGNNPEDLDYVENLLANNPNVVLDTSARIAEFGRHDPKRVRKLFMKYADRILFGTDTGLTVRRRGRKTRYSLMLGSVSKEPPRLEDLGPFFEKHWAYFESDVTAIEHPIPIQGDWKVHPIDLPQKVRRKVYAKNAERVIFAPHFGRQAAYHVRSQAGAVE